MRKLLKSICYAALACGAFALIACGDDGSGPVSPEKKEDNGEGRVYNAFMDKRDGNVYRVIKVGNMTWMAENLRYKDTAADPMLDGHVWCAYEDVAMCDSLGYLYSWDAVMLDESCASSMCDVDYPHRGICPEGWHVPENYEWQALADLTADRGTPLGEYPGFDWTPTGEFSGYEASLDDVARFWTASSRVAQSAIEWYLYADSRYFKSQEYKKSYGYALRCVADGTPDLDAYVKYEDPRPRSSSSVNSSSSGKSSSSSVRESSSSVKESSSSVKESSSSGKESSSSANSSSSAKSSSSTKQSSSSEKGSSSSKGPAVIGDTTLNAFTDKRDGEVYRVVKFGDQVWMADDLRYKDAEASPILIRRGWKYFENEMLYSYAAVMDDLSCESSLCEVTYPHRGICPEGWHVPEDSEWETLAKTMKSQGAFIFDDEGFNAEWSGEFKPDSGIVSYGHEYVKYARYWSATQFNALSSVEWYAEYFDSSVFRSQNISKMYGYALRCVADGGEVKLDKHVDYLPSSFREAPSSSSMEPIPEAYKVEKITDARDGNEYEAVSVGAMLMWMTDNLRYADSVATPALKGNVSCIGGNGNERCEDGLLYTYAAVAGDLDCATGRCFLAKDDAVGICPDGWRWPKKADWEYLINVTTQKKEMLKMFKLTSTGERRDNGYVSYDSYARFWLSTEDRDNSAYEGYILPGSSEIKIQGYTKAFGYAVRCVKDVELYEY